MAAPTAMVAVDERPSQTSGLGHHGPGAAAAGRTSRLWRWYIVGFVIFWLIVTSGAIFPLLVQGTEPDLSDGQRAQLRLLLLPCLAMPPLLVVLRFRGMVSLLLRNPVVVLLVLWIALSVLWSVDADLTARRALSFTANTLIACYLVLHRDLDWMLKVQSWCMLILLLASLAFILLFPALGALADDRGLVRGLNGAFVHKNSMGETIVFSLIIFFAAYKKQAVPNVISLGGLLLALLLLVPTGAATSIVVALFVLLIQAWLLTERMPFEHRLTLFAFAVALACLVVGAAVLNIDLVFALLGRDATLTGRTDIWPYVLHMSAQRPVVGYGYASFWEMEAIASYVKDRFQWSIPTAHNGYLDVLLGLGWIGLALLIAFFCTMIFRLITRARHLEPGVLAFALPSLVYYLIFNLVESAFFSSSGLSWIVMVTAVFLLTPGLPAIRAAAVRG